MMAETPSNESIDPTAPTGSIPVPGAWVDLPEGQG